MKQFDVVVIGGGHAGTEAAAAAARRGARVALLSQRQDHIGVMSCNPSIGGLGKGHLVREVDAFDGLMARAADDSAIHYRMLNRSKGRAVQGPRVQADRHRYRTSIMRQLRDHEKLSIVEGEATDLIVENTTVKGVVVNGDTPIEAKAVVLATGTFLGGTIYRGTERLDGGRVGEAGAHRLAHRLRELRLAMNRLKTGTPPRLDGRTIDWARLTPQPSDEEPWRMSSLPQPDRLPQLACAITRTTSATHDIIRRHLSTSPLFGGAIEGQGPRYCPSIEDKVDRFGDRDGHQVFLEPEGLDTNIVYPNGISTSLSSEAQVALIATIPGLEQTTITTLGYAVEYDYLDPRSLDHRLALSAIAGLFCAGQINGTTGYEEAAAQGLIAGLNAAAHACHLEPVVVDRATGYVGVLIDDLVLQGVSEPYRMLTARAEFRLSLRSDNAETRLSAVALQADCLSPARAGLVERRRAQRSALAAGMIDPSLCDPDIVGEVAEDRHYAPYIARQRDEIDRLRRDGAVAIPSAAALPSVPGLSNEMIERLTASNPRTLSEASRVRGITPAALAALWLHARSAK